MGNRRLPVRGKDISRDDSIASSGPVPRTAIHYLVRHGGDCLACACSGQLCSGSFQAARRLLSECLDARAIESSASHSKLRWYFAYTDLGSTTVCGAFSAVALSVSQSNAILLIALLAQTYAWLVMAVPFDWKGSPLARMKFNYVLVGALIWWAALLGITVYMIAAMALPHISPQSPAVPADYAWRAVAQPSCPCGRS